MNTKTQTMFMIGIALLVMSGILIYVSLSTPGVYKESETTAIQISSSTVAVTNRAKSPTAASKGSDNSATAVSYPINLKLFN